VLAIFDGEKEAQLIALACSQPPKGRARWTLRLLEDKVVELNILDRASDSTIGRVLKKHSQASSPKLTETYLHSVTDINNSSLLRPGAFGYYSPY
jgi:hypothetical protein